MHRMTGRTAILAIAGLAAVLPIATYAYTTYGKWHTLPVIVYVNPANADVSATAAESAIQTAMNVWNTQPGTPFRFQYGGRVTSTTTGYDSRNVVLFRNATNGGAIGSTYWWTMGSEVVDADVVFWDAGSTFFTGTSGCLTGGVYIEDAATHELGHVLGLNHSSVAEATMSPNYTRCSQTLRTLASDDISGIRSLYGTSSGSNTAPTVSIAAPANNASFTQGTAIAFSGSATDTQDGNLTSGLIWTSSLDGQIGSGGSFSKALSAGTHVITARVTDGGGLSTSKQITITVTSTTTTTTTTTTTWSTRDIGAVAAAGSFTYSSGKFTVKGSGADIWGTADEFRFVYRTLTGDGSIVARVASLTNTSGWAKAGVMMRESLNAGSKHASMFVTPGNGLAFQFRSSTGGTSSTKAGGTGTAPYWVKLVRSGSKFSAYKSTTGSSWTLVSQQTLAVGSTIYVGLAVTSHKDGTVATATFTNEVGP